jgi:hypothetical protein
MNKFIKCIQSVLLIPGLTTQHSANVNTIEGRKGHEHTCRENKSELRFLELKLLRLIKN